MNNSSSKNKSYKDQINSNIEITNISWERIFLTFQVTSDIDSPLTFKLRRFNLVMANEPSKEASYGIKEEITVDSKPLKNSRYSITLNMSAANGNQFLSNGKWQLIAVSKEGERPCFVGAKLAYKVSDYSKIFRYADDQKAYTIDFAIYSDRNNYLTVFFNSQFMSEDKKWEKRNYIKEVKGVNSKVKAAVKTVVLFLIKTYYGTVNPFFPKKGNNILFMGETKEYIWGNLLYIDSRIKARGLDKGLNVSYSFRNAVGEKINWASWKSWLKTVTLIAKQDTIFVDDYAPIFNFINLSKKTKLVQVWHAGEGFKSVGYSRFGKEGTPHPNVSSHKKYTHVITASESLIPAYSEVFGLPADRFMPLGMARLDGFLDEEKIAQFRSGFYKENPTFRGKKIILFAPTFRGFGQKDAGYDYRQLDLSQIHDFCKEEYIFMFKMHPFIEEQPKIPQKFKDRIVNFTSYENINDLYYVTEVLVTDYSSNFFEFALMKKPALFFTYDRENYEITRGVHRSVAKNAPGKVCDTFEQLMIALENKDYEEEKMKKFYKTNFGDYDGRAADKIIDMLILPNNQQ